MIAACSTQSTSDSVDTDSGGGDTAGLDGTTDTGGADEDGAQDSDPEGDGGEQPLDDVDEIHCIFDDDCEAAGEICINAACVVGCRRDVECEDDNPCTENLCRDSACVTTPRDVVLEDDRSGDCRIPACVDGVETYLAAPADVPPPDPEVRCVEWRCDGMTPIPMPNDSLCRDSDPSTADAYCLPGDGCRVGEPPGWVCAPFEPGYIGEEICGNGVDDNGDGQVDEGCPCNYGEVQRCFPGPPAARGVGQCRDGYQQCIDRDNPRWSPCVGAILPSEEVCDNRDNTCNGCVDDIPDCDPVIACPGDQVVEPFREYELDAFELFGDTFESIEWDVILPTNSNSEGPRQPDSAQTSVFLDVSGDYQISATLKDGKNASFACSWVVSARGSGVRAELRWDTFGVVDLDLHMHRSGSEADFCTPDDCYFSTCRSQFGQGVSWGYSASPGSKCGQPDTVFCRNPRLDIDNVRGDDPENINIDNPRDGDRFRFMVHMYGGGTPTRPVLTIYCGGGLSAIIGEAPDEVVLSRAGGGCRGHTWRVADVTVIVEEDTGGVSCLVTPLSNDDGEPDLRLNDASY